MSEYLSAKELHDVTDYARAAQQVAWLKFRGIPHNLNTPPHCHSFDEVAAGFQSGAVDPSGLQSRLRVQASTDSPTSRRWLALAGAGVSLQYASCSAL